MKCYPYFRGRFQQRSRESQGIVLFAVLVLYSCYVYKSSIHFLVRTNMTVKWSTGNSGHYGERQILKENSLKAAVCIEVLLFLSSLTRGYSMVTPQFLFMNSHILK